MSIELVESKSPVTPGRSSVRRMRQEVFQPDATVSYSEVADILRTEYQFDESIESTSLDILALYLKGQKIIYTESKTFCEKQLNLLMLPAIFIAAVCSILNFILKDYPYGVIIISCMNAFNSFLLSLISYLKLDGKAEAHKTSAYKFQKLESLCEFNSGKHLFFRDSFNVLTFVQNVEKEVIEIRESNQFIVPTRVRERFPVIYSTNVFSLVKQIQNDEILVINQLKTSVQKLHLAFKKKKEKLLEMDRLQTMIAEMKSAAEAAEVKEALIQDIEAATKRLDLIQEDLLEMDQNIREAELVRDKSFADTVKHRERYLNLAKTYQADVDASASHMNYCDMVTVT
jgi:hypothetical protein